MSAALDTIPADIARPGFHAAFDPVARAQAAADVIAAHADVIDEQRCLPQPVLDALHGGGLFRMLLPRSLGGFELEPHRYVQMIMVLAAADASTAWCVGQGSGCSMAAAYMSPDAARTIWGDDPRAVLAWGAGTTAVARVVEDGFLVNGAWGFASGNRHATWIGGHCRIEEPDGTRRCWPDGSQVECSMLFPRAQGRFDDRWDVMGLRGTGSDSYKVVDLFVPERFTVCRDVPELRRESGTLYRFTTTHLYAAGFGAVALGIARGTLDALIALARVKTPSAQTLAMRDSAVVQSHVALAEARLSAARLLLVETLRDAWDEAARTGELSIDTRVRIRMSATFATHQAKDVVSTAYHEAGATAIFESNPFERRFRDVHCVSQQVQARFSHFETVGAHMLGAPANLRFI